VTTRPLLDLVDDWREFLRGGLSAAEHEVIRAHERTGRPLGDKRFVARLEKRLGRTLAGNRVEIRDDDARARLVQAAGDSESDPHRAAGDDCRPVGEIKEL